ncbi:hypothetical protein Tco_0190632 [Tanacetum coccineum]
MNRTVDEDAMDKEVKDRVKGHKRKHDSNDDEDNDDDEGPSAGSNQDDEQSLKKPQDSDASASKQHPTLTSTGWQIIDTRDAVIDSSMHRSEPESGHSKHSSDDVSKQDEGNVSDMEDTDNAHIPKWLLHENNWANAYATTYQVFAKNKLQRKTYDIGSTASSSSSQNVAFISENINNTNDVSTAYSVSNTSGQNPQTGKKEDSKALVTIDGEDREQLSDASIEIMAYSKGLRKVESQLVCASQQGQLWFVTAGWNGSGYPTPMTGNYMPSGPDIEVDYSQFTYGPKQTQPSESESQSSEFDTCESNIRLRMYKIGGGGGGSVDVVSVVSVTLEGTSADAVRALKIWFLSFFCLSKTRLHFPIGTQTLNLNNTLPLNR